MTYPSVKTIASIYYLDQVHTCDRAKNALIIRKILDDRLDPLEYIEACQDNKVLSGAHWVTFDIPNHIYRRNKLGQKLWAIDQILECHGVECIQKQDGSQDVVMEYCNTGESDQLTIAYDWLKNKFVVTSWGDWIERNDPNGTKYLTK